MRDFNGQPLQKGGLALLLCQIVDVVETDNPPHVRIRVSNSDHEMAVGARHDEALGGLIADSELTAFLETHASPQNRPISAFE